MALGAVIKKPHYVYTRMSNRREIVICQIAFCTTMEMKILWYINILINNLASILVSIMEGKPADYDIDKK